MLNKDIEKVVEFMVEYKPRNNSPSNVLVSAGLALGDKPIKFLLVPESLQNVKDVRIWFECLYILLFMMIIVDVSTAQSNSKVQNKRLD